MTFLCFPQHWLLKYRSGGRYLAENFSLEVIKGANQFFVALQKQVGWLDFNNTTKTAYAYESL